MVSHAFRCGFFDVGELDLLVIVLDLGRGLGFGCLGGGFGLGGLELLRLVLSLFDEHGGFRLGGGGLQRALGTLEALELLPIAGDLEQVEPYGRSAVRRRRASTVRDRS